MEKKIAEILKDIYAIAPDLRAREEELKKTVKKLISSKPQTKMDPAFKEELLQEILQTYGKVNPHKKKKKKLFLRPVFIVPTAASLLLMVVGFLLLRQTKGFNDHEMVQSMIAKVDNEQSNTELEKETEKLAVQRDMEKPKERKKKKISSQKVVAKQSVKKRTPVKKKQKNLKGNLEVTVKVADGSRIPGVSGKLTAQNGKKIENISNEEGIINFKALPAGDYELTCELEGFKTARIENLKISDEENREDVILELGEIKTVITITGEAPLVNVKSTSAQTTISREVLNTLPTSEYSEKSFNTESYDYIKDNSFLEVVKTPLSTFSIDVDTASYANVRRFLWNRQLPPKDAVRIEELINYFPYDYPLPSGERAFSVITEVASCPWNQDHYLLLLGLKGKDLPEEEIPHSNLVFLLDVSGSMDEPKKLPLLVDSFKMLTHELTDKDRVAIVVYAGSSGLVLPATPGNEKKAIVDALNRLQAGGSTAGGAGIKLAYDIASRNFIKGGNNRVILATDGDFNVGPSSDADMVRLIEDKRKRGVFLTVLGFGMGNYKDAKMEKLADKGNGNYFYIDSLLEAKKVLVNDLRKNLFTIAKDVKIQIEFNPAKVKSYRLLGYENRLLQKEEFADDSKDAGEIGAGHTVTAFYELIPQKDQDKISENRLRYQRYRLNPETATSREILHIKIRHKKPDEERSVLMSKVVREFIVPAKKTSETFRFASAVAEFGLLLRNSQFKGKASFKSLLKRARDSRGSDRYGYRHEFVKLAQIAADIMNNKMKKE